jgi:hypothetical protein
MPEEKELNKEVEAEQIEVVEEETMTRRHIEEIIPTDTAPEVNDPEPPKLTIPGVMGIVKKKGLAGALSDDAWGPHVHLVMLLVIIFLIALGIALIQSVIG